MPKELLLLIFSFFNKKESYETQKTLRLVNKSCRALIDINFFKRKFLNGGSPYKLIYHVEKDNDLSAVIKYWHAKDKCHVEVIDIKDLPAKRKELAEKYNHAALVTFRAETNQWLLGRYCGTGWEFKDIANIDEFNMLYTTTLKGWIMDDLEETHIKGIKKTIGKSTKDDGISIQEEPHETYFFGEELIKLHAKNSLHAKEPVILTLFIVPARNFSDGKYQNASDYSRTYEVLQSQRGSKLKQTEIGSRNLYINRGFRAGILRVGKEFIENKERSPVTDKVLEANNLTIKALTENFQQKALEFSKARYLVDFT